MKKKYNKFIKIDGKTLIVGIDIGKNVHYGRFITLTYEAPKSFAFSNSKAGFELLIKKIKSFIKKHQVSNVIVGMESTGSYWFPLAYYLKDNTDFTLVQVNCKHTKKFKDVTDNSSNKTDQKDPKVIAQIVLIGSSLRVNLPEGDKASIRELTRSRKAIISDKKKTVNRLHALLSTYFPEIITMFKDISCKTCIYLLKHYPRPEDVLHASKEVLSKELRKVSRGRFGLEKAQKLIANLTNSIGVKSGVEGYLAILGAYLEQLIFFESQVVAMEEQIHQRLALLDEYHILKSVKGLGNITIATIISEVVDFKNYKTHKELLKFAGLNLVENSSGNHKGKRRISKIGNKHLRTCLYFTILRLIKEGGIYHELYKSHLDKGMEKKRAIIAITRKLLKTIHFIIKKNEIFKVEYELKQFKKAA